MSQYVLDKMAFFPYKANPTPDPSTEGYVNGWDTSLPYAFLNNKYFTGLSSEKSSDWDAKEVDYTSSGFLNGFSASELGLVPSVDVKAGSDTGTHKSSAQSLFYLGWEYNLMPGNIGWGADDSVTTTNLFGGDTKSNLLGYFKDSPGANPEFWWLRSPYVSFPFAAMVVEDDVGQDDVSSVDGSNVASVHGIRPAFKLNPVSVIFASEIVSGSPGMGQMAADGTNYAAAAGGAKNFKLTVLNTDLQLTSISDSTGGIQNNDTRTVVLGGSLPLQATVPVDTANALAYKIVDVNGKIAGYGTAASVTDITVDAGALAVGYYTVYVWAQRSSDINSHEGSAPIHFELVISEPPPEPTQEPVQTQGLGSPQTGNNTNLPLWALCGVGALAGLIVLLVTLNRKRQKAK